MSKISINNKGFVENLFTEGKMRTRSGIYVDILNPTEDMIIIEDIIWALSHIPRFGGHLPKWYSVADHCLYVSVLCEDKYSLEGLLHDASEAYIADIITPLKKELSNYYDIEDKFNKVIANKFKIQYPFPEAIKIADKKALEIEWNVMISNKDMKYSANEDIADFQKTMNDFYMLFNLLKRN